MISFATMQANGTRTRNMGMTVFLSTLMESRSIQVNSRKIVLTVKEAYL